MAGGTAQINPFSEYFQESERDMKSNINIFEGNGISRGIHYRVPFSCEGKPDNVEDIGCDSKYIGSQDMEAEGIPEGFYTGYSYDYSNDVFFDYSKNTRQNINTFMTLCDPLKENITKCKERIFECGQEPWKECVKRLKNCNENVCKYENDGNTLIKKFTPPPIKETNTKPLCTPGENTERCLKRVYMCDPDRPWKECYDQLGPCPDDKEKTCKFKMTKKELVEEFPMSPGPKCDTNTCYKEHYKIDAKECDGTVFSDCGYRVLPCENDRNKMCKYKVLERERIGMSLNFPMPSSTLVLEDKQIEQMTVTIPPQPIKEYLPPIVGSGEFFSTTST